MNKNRALLLIIVVVVVVIAALAIFYFLTVRGTIPGQPIPPDDSSFPVQPNGSGGATSTPGTVGDTGNTVNNFQNLPQTFQKQKLRLLSSLPVSGATIFQKNADTFVRYVDRAEGHIYETRATQNESPYRISNNTIPKIYEAYWVQNGQGTVIRYLKEGSDNIQTFYANIRSGATTSEQQLENGVFLANNITGFAVSPATDKMFYLVKSGGQTVGIRANANTTQKVQLFSSPLHEWLVTWPASTVIALSTKPSSSVGGVLYFLNTNSGSVTKILSGVAGLTALPNTDASMVLYSEADNEGIALKLFDTRTGTARDLGTKTLPEKCVWSRTNKVLLYCATPDNLPLASYPDTWYQGSVSFTDNVWSINTKTGETKIILTPQSVARQTMDIMNPVIDASDRYLLFTNKKDLSLWLLDLQAE